MAKKKPAAPRKKTATKVARKKPAKKAARPKPAAKSPPAKKAPKTAAVDPNAPFHVSTGRGASVAEIGTDLVSLYNAGRIDEIEGKWWSPAIVSCEGAGVEAEWRGRKAVEAKNAWWYSENELLGASAEGPFLGATGFAVRFKMQYRIRATGEIKQMSEVGVYSVNNGKIVREEFMYGT